MGIQIPGCADYRGWYGWNHVLQNLGRGKVITWQLHSLLWSDAITKNTKIRLLNAIVVTLCNICVRNMNPKSKAQICYRKWILEMQLQNDTVGPRKNRRNQKLYGSRDIYNRSNREQTTIMVCPYEMNERRKITRKSLELEGEKEGSQGWSEFKV